MLKTFEIACKAKQHFALSTNFWWISICFSTVRAIAKFYNRVFGPIESFGPTTYSVISF